MQLEYNNCYSLYENIKHILTVCINPHWPLTKQIRKKKMNKLIKNNLICLFL